MEILPLRQTLKRSLITGTRNAVIIYLAILVWIKLTLPIFKGYITQPITDPFQSQSISYNFIWIVVIAPLLYVLIFQAIMTRMIIRILINHAPLKLNEFGIRILTSIIIAGLLLAPFYNLPDRLIVLFPVGYTIAGIYVNHYFSEGSKHAFLITWFTLTLLNLVAFLRYYLMP
jgi:hypothetical protein